MSLTEELAKCREGARERIPADKRAVMARATEDLAKSGLTDTALKEGDFAPEFSLPNASGKPVSLSEMLKKGPVALSFYRGGW